VHTVCEKLVQLVAAGGTLSPILFAMLTNYTLSARWTMPEIISCPGCRRNLKLPDNFSGREVCCPACKLTFRADAANSALPPSAAVSTNRQPFPPPVDRPAQRRHARDDYGFDESEGPSRRSDRGSLPSRRSAPALAPQKRRRNPLVTFLFVGLAAVLLLTGVLYVVTIFQDERTYVPPQTVVVVDPPIQQDDPQLRKDAKEAFLQQKPLNEDEIVRELKPFFKELGKAVVDKDGETAVSYFDVPRMFDEMAQHEMLPQKVLQGRAEVIRGMHIGLSNQITKQGVLWEWNSFEIKHVKKLAADEAVVIVRHRTVDGRFLKIRWWLTKSAGTWKVFDLQDLDMGLRSTAMMANIINAGLDDLQATARNLRALIEAMKAAISQDLILAEKELQSIAGQKLPRSMEAMRWFVTASVRLQRGQNVEALQAADKAHSYQPDMPALNLMKAIAHNNLAQWDKALDCLEKYRALLGEDPEVCYEMGEALRGLGRFPESAAAYRKALDEEPTHFNAFQALLRALAPLDRRDDLGARFAKLPRPHRCFDLLAAECKTTRDGGSLEQISHAMLKIDPEFADAEFCLALAKAWSMKSEEAVALFESALKKQKDAAKRQDYTQEFLPAVAQGGGAVKVYNLAPDPRAAFALLAPELKKQYRTDELRKLVAAHAKKHPQDILLAFYRADVYVQDGKYQLADKAFTAAMANPPDESIVSQFASSRVIARYYSGKALSAYEEIGTKEDTFKQLASLCLTNENYPVLEALLAAHTKNGPDDVEILYWWFRLRIRQDRIKEATGLFDKALNKTNADGKRRQIISDFLYDMVDAGKPIQAYMAAPDSKQAFQLLGDDLLSLGRMEDVQQLVAAHTKREPDDVWLDYYRAQLHIKNKDWDKAAGLLAQAVKKEPADAFGRFRHAYILAMYRAGKVAQAYAQIEPRKETYYQLANLLITDQNGTALEALIAAHRPHADADPEVHFHEARAKAFLKQTNQAILALQKAYEVQGQEHQRKFYVSQVVQDLAAGGQGLEGYRGAPDKAAAFQALASHMMLKKNDKGLAELLAEHGKQHADDAWFLFYQGEWHLLRGENATAEKCFTRALVKIPPQNEWLFRNGLWRARIKVGKTVVTYQEIGPGTRGFEDLAYLCLQDKNVNELQALLASHRLAEPEETDLAGWDVEIRWLKQDYEGVLKLLDDHKGVFAEPRHRWKYEAFLVRALVKMKRFDDAVKQAETFAKRKYGNQLLLVLAHAARGDVKQTIAVIEGHKHSNAYLVSDCYRHEDLGPILRSEAFRDFRDRFPEPKEPFGRFDDDPWDLGRG
jgi:predicted Zn-dependent protease